MGYKYIEAIPLSNIGRIELYMNTGRKSLAAIKKLKGCQYIMNGTIYMFNTFKPCCNVKSNGVVYNNPGYSEYGYYWNNNDIGFGSIPKSSYRNYIGCVKMIKDGVAVKKMNYNSDMGGTRGRTAIGIKGNSLVLYCSKDGSSYAKTPEKLRDEMAAYGCSSALMLDGGGSSQCDFNGKTITSSRIVQNLVLVYLKDSNDKVNNGASSSSGAVNTSSSYMGATAARSYIRAFQSWMNRTYRTGISTDGYFGYKTKRAAIISLQRYLVNERKCSLTITGVFDSATKNAISKAIPVIRSGDKGNLVKIAQGMLYCRGVNAKGFDGSFGPGMRAGVSWYQTHSNLTDTGTVNLNTWSNLLK